MPGIFNLATVSFPSIYLIGRYYTIINRRLLTFAKARNWRKRNQFLEVIKGLHWFDILVKKSLNDWNWLLNDLFLHEKQFTYNTK
jgi:hypothetical protein